jgi:hypothetical protein
LPYKPSPYYNEYRNRKNNWSIQTSILPFPMQYDKHTFNTDFIIKTMLLPYSSYTHRCGLLYFVLPTILMWLEKLPNILAIQIDHFIPQHLL